jgi:tetratricopeptide (TPR) repeat protein
MVLALMGVAAIAWSAPKGGKAKPGAAKAKAESEQAGDNSQPAAADAETSGGAKSADQPPLVALQGGEGSGNPGPLYHQVMHQAFLATAREEFAAGTYDAPLREAAPKTTQHVETFQLFSNFNPAQVKFEVTLNRMQAGKATQLWRKQFTIEKPNHDALEKEVTRAEAAMHAEFFDSLKADGLAPVAHAWRDDASVPADVQNLLTTLTIPSQFAAARKLHALIREDAESPERLSALARAYANLGMLTEYFWTTSTKDLTARALLYAERLYAKQPDVPALWCRGYVRALAGRQSTALADFEAAHQHAASDGGKPNEATPPTWAALAEAYCKYDAKALTENVEERYVPLASWLYYCAVEPSYVSPFLGTVVDSVLEKTPDAYRVIDAMTRESNYRNNWALRQMGAEYGLSTSGQYIYSELNDLPDAPAPIKEICQAVKPGSDEGAEEYKRRAKLMAALRAADADVKLRGEPSWSALASLFEDVALVQVFRALNSRAGGADDPVEQMWPLVADHPLGPLVKLHSNDDAVRKAAQQAAQNVKLQSLTMSGRHLFNGLPWYGGDEKVYEKMDTDVFHRFDETFRDDWQVYQDISDEFRDRVLLEQLLKDAPHMPVTVGGLLARQHDLAAPRVVAWEQQYAGNPDILLRLGRFYRDDGKYDEAIRIWQAALKQYPEEEIYSLMAETYLKQGDEDHWLATWEECMEKLPEPESNHTGILNNIARHSMRQRQWEKAWPYAQRAVDSGSSESLQTQAYCAEALQKWDLASEDFSAYSQQNSSDIFDWYWFCRRTGFGNQDEALQLLQKSMANYEPNSSDLMPYYYSVSLALDRRFEEANRWVSLVVGRTKDEVILMYAALLADRLGHSADRDAYLRKILSESPQHPPEELTRPAVEIISLAELMVDDLAAGGEGKIDYDEAARRGASAEPGQKGAFFFFLGDYYEIHGQKALTTKCWQQAMLDSRIDGTGRTLAGARLSDSFVSPDEYRTALQQPLSKEELHPGPLPKLRHPPDAVAFGEHYYKFIPHKAMTWSEAKQLADYMGGYLACIGSEDEEKFVASLCKRKTAWLGGYREKGQWKWLSGEPFGYENWAQPNIEQPYLHTMPGGKWQAMKNYPGQAGFVCEWGR